MVPINQVILGGDPLLGSSMVGNSLDEQLQLIEKYKQNLYYILVQRCGLQIQK